MHTHNIQLHYNTISYEFGPVVHKMSFGPIILRSWIICAILVEGIVRNDSVKLFFEFGQVVQEILF